MFINLIMSVVVSIASFGAVCGNDTVDNAPAINRAIASCASQGGGTVVVPEGVFRTGSVYLKSNVMLHLDRGATLKGVDRLDAYQPLKTSADLSRYESGVGTVNYNSATDPQWSKAMVFAVGVNNAGIEGEGSLDGADVRNPKGEEGMRGPHTVLLADCRDMRFEGFSVKHSANYAFLGYQLSSSRFERLLIEGGWDGIHLRGATDVAITHCELHTGDDAIAGGYWHGMTISRNVLNSSCNGIRMIMPSTRLDICDNTIYGPGRYEHITSRRTRSEAAINLEPGGWGPAPGRLDSIRILRNDIASVLTPLCVTLGNENSLGCITVEDMQARGITRMAMSVKSWGAALTDKVVMHRCRMEFDEVSDAPATEWFDSHPTSQWPVFPVWGMYFRNVGRVDAQAVELVMNGADKRNAYRLDNVKSSRLKNIDVREK